MVYSTVNTFSSVHTTFTNYCLFKFTDMFIDTVAMSLNMYGCLKTIYNAKTTLYNYTYNFGYTEHSYIFWIFWIHFRLY